MKDFKSILGGKKSDKKEINPKDETSIDIPQDNKEPANLTIHSIFVKDASYEAPETPRVFALPWAPQVKFDIQVMRRSMEKPAGLHEVVLHTTISTQLQKPKGKDEKPAKDDKGDALTAFVIDLKMAGMFTIQGLADDQLDRVLSTTAPTILFPYAAEAVSSMVTKGGFPQFILPPIDFATLYKQRMAEQSKK